MATAPSRQVVQDSQSDGDSGGYIRLREILVGPEQKQLEELHHRLDDRELRAEDVSEVVAEAIALRIQRDRKLQHTFDPLVEEAVRISVARDPSILANALFPVIGEAVRKSVAHALRALVDTINQTLERRFSIQALKWRIEAFRTGRSFGEIVLTRSVHYRVEEVFLIHRETGLLLQHVSRADQVIQDSDLVSGMLTAIQDFVRDSFRRASDQEIDTIELADFKLWVQSGPAAMLAAVISGTPPPELRNLLQRTLEKIHREYGPAMRSPQRDRSIFVATRPLLLACLLGQQPYKRDNRAKALFAAAAAVLVILLALTTISSLRAQRQWDALIERLQLEPGIVLTQAGRSGGRYRLIGLRDPLSSDPQTLIAAAGIDPRRVTTRWEPYASDDARLKSLREFMAEKTELEQEVVRFSLNSTELAPGEASKLDDLASHVVLLQQSGNATGQRVAVELRGHTDRSGNETKNATLSARRAEAMSRALVARGVSASMLRTVGMASSEAVQRTPGANLPEMNRAVTFRVINESEAR